MMPSSSFFLRKFYFLAKILKSEEVSHGDHVLGLRAKEDDTFVSALLEVVYHARFRSVLIIGLAWLDISLRCAGIQEIELLMF